MAQYTLTVNGKSQHVDAWDPQMPLLYALRNTLGLHAVKFLQAQRDLRRDGHGGRGRSCERAHPRAARGNAVFDATGVRVRTVPFTPARLKAAWT